MQRSFLDSYEAALLRDAHLSNVESTLLPASENSVTAKRWTHQLCADLIQPGL